MTGAGRSPDPALLRATTPIARVVYRLLLGTGAALAKIAWRYEITGRDRLPSVGPFVLCPVHRSNADFLLAGIAGRRRMHFMAKASLWHNERFGSFLEMMGAFPVDRDHPDRMSIRRAQDCLELGEPVVMFPEGRRREGSVVDDLHEGPAFVACRTRVPLVPMAIGGSDRALPRGARFIRPFKVRVLIGEPIYPDVPLTGRVPRRAVTETTEQLRRSLQDLYDEVR
jgi:1-acyl-sn-glycerol-3-phosphate acyltransferase